MTRPKLVLPSLSMPWGRWVEGELDETEAEIARQSADSSSASSVLASRANLLQTQIGTIPSVAAVYQRDIPPFSVFRSFTPGATAYVYSSAAQVFNPPRPDRPYDYRVIAVMDVAGVNLPFSRSLLRTNGIDNMYQHENQQPGFQTRATYSIAGSGSIGSGGTVSAECGIVASDVGTLTFNRATLWCVFTGSIL